MNIVVDIDDTIAEFIPRVVLHINKMFDKDIDTNSLTPGWMKDKLSAPEWDALQPMIYNHTFYLALELAHDWTQTYDFLTRGSRLHYLTARKAPLRESAEEITRKWIQRKHLPVRDGILICHHMDDKVDHLPPNTDIVVEDSPDVALSVEAAGLPVILIDRPWNRHVMLQHKHSARVSSMYEASSALAKVRGG